MINLDNKDKKILDLENLAERFSRWIGSVSSLIVHTIIFIISFSLPYLFPSVVKFETMLAVLTNVLSLEAIYLAIFVQMSVNKSREHIEEIQEDIEDIQEDIEDISDDIDEISEDIEDIQEDIDEISEDIDEIQEDIEEINEEEEEEEEDHNERAKNVMLKSNVSLNKTEIKQLKEKIAFLTQELEKLKNEESQEEEKSENS